MRLAASPRAYHGGGGGDGDEGNRWEASHSAFYMASQGHYTKINQRLSANEKMQFAGGATEQLSAQTRQVLC